MSPVRHLVLSPHLDDAAFSCTAWIADKRSMGHDVLVASVFTHPGQTASEEEVALYATRRREDEQAMAILGARHLHLGLPDAPFRTATYRSFAGLLFDPVAPGDPAPAWVSHRIEHLLRDLRPQCVHAPLAVGTHVDHRIVFEAARTLEPLHGACAFSYYEDRPYSLVDGSVALRLRSLGWEPPGQATIPASQSAFVSSFLRAAYVRRHLRAEDRKHVLALIESQWIASQAAPERPGATSQVLFAARDDAERAFAAMQAYSSQLADFFGSEEAARAVLGLEAGRRHPTGAGGARADGAARAFLATPTRAEAAQQYASAMAQRAWALPVEPFGLRGPLRA